MRRMFRPRAAAGPRVRSPAPAGRRKAVPVSDLQSQINQRIAAFVTDIAELARRQALATLAGALGGAPVRGRGRGTTASGAARAKGEKRPAAEIAATVDRLGHAVASQPGLRIEELARNLACPTKILTLPMKKLLADGLVRSEGQRRATRYFPADGAAPTRRRKRGGK